MLIRKLFSLLGRGVRPVRPLRVGLVLMPLFVGFWAGCALGPMAADRSFAAGDYIRAAKKYEAYLQEQASGSGRERVLFRLILLYSSPETPIHDKKRSQALRELLVEEFPGGPYGSWVSWQFFLERRIGILRDELERQTAQAASLAVKLEEAREEAAQNRQQLESLQAELDARLAEMRALENRLAEARNEATGQKERMERLTEALELLKNIDLKRSP